MAKGIGFAAARQRGRDKLEQWMTARVNQGQAFVVEAHETAPRGGASVNSFGQPRSAGGEAPAIEFGNLLMRLNAPPEREPLRVTLFVNWAPLENYNADARLDPRPLGRPMIEFLKTTRPGA